VGRQRVELQPETPMWSRVSEQLPRLSESRRFPNLLADSALDHRRSLVVIVLLTGSLGACIPDTSSSLVGGGLCFTTFSVAGCMHKCSKLRSKLLGHATSSCHLLQCHVVSSQLSTTIVRSQGRIASKQAKRIWSRCVPEVKASER
jgi:hypothetical protein